MKGVIIVAKNIAVQPIKAANLMKKSKGFKIGVKSNSIKTINTIPKLTAIKLTDFLFEFIFIQFYNFMTIY